MVLLWLPVVAVLIILGYLAFSYFGQVIYIINRSRHEHDDKDQEWWSKRRDILRWPGSWVARGLYEVVSELWKDAVLAVTFFYIKAQMRSKAGREWSTADYFRGRFEVTPDRTAIVTEGETYTFRQLEESSNAVARWAQDGISLRRGDVCAILMETSPDFIIMWLGLTKVAAVGGLINTNLSHAQLVHAVNLAMADTLGDKVLVVSRSLSERLWSLKNELKGIRIICYEDELKPDLLAKYNHGPPIDPSVRNGIRSTVVLFYVYTSGTTGMPKAAKITHWRNFSAGVAFSNLYGIGSEDRVYCALPLYHSAGGMIGVSLSFYNGCPLILPKRFSASRFWDDCRKFDVTVVQYIGELCRYLMAQNPSSEDKAHRVRLALGNGLRPEIWQAFESRFGVACGEFYASTEGNVNLFNNRGRQGAIGYMSDVMQLIYKVRFIALDPVSEEPLRDESGLCIQVHKGEAGEAVGLIDPSDASRRFDGYTDSTSTERKVLSNVLVMGDRYFRSGDLLRWDHDGYIYFADRIGDTFRWKGENVATTEVSAVIIEADVGVEECNVYGVAIPGMEGRAGAAALRPRPGGLDLQKLYDAMAVSLAHYSRPLFVRVLHGTMEVTTTFKHRKVELVKEGFDPTQIDPEDQLWFRDDSMKCFVPLDADLYQRIRNGAVRL